MSQKTNPRIGRYETLQHLPNPQRSLALLHRLATDPGILHAMNLHDFHIGTLREMEPLGATTIAHDGTTRTLGLNHNRGQIIDLRLRTDAYDGYRDYKTIRKTFCHELAHNVHGEHDAKFWKLCGEIEKEVERGDYWKGGHRLTNEVFYNPPEREELKPAGVTGGTFRLGGGSGMKTAAPAQGGTGQSMREILAKAAEERRKRGAAA